MSARSWTMVMIPSLLCMIMAAACAAPATVVKATCAISWDRSADYWRVAEYRITVWKVKEQQASDKSTHVVKAPATQVSCQEVGANTNGRWQATVHACLSDGTCSEASQPMSFQVADK